MEAKSNAEETEKERLCVSGRGVVAAGWLAESGSSLERESFREDEMPDGDDDRELFEDEGVEEARDASSRESRARLLDGEGRAV